MKQQVIKFSGSLETGFKAETLRGGFLDLRKLGEVSVRRSSEIEFDETTQMHYISLLEPKLEHLNETLRGMFFPTYEDAVDFEVRLLNYARKTTDFWT